MLQTMENHTFLNKISIFAFAILSLISCEPHEDKLELYFERQATGQVFSIADRKSTRLNSSHTP